MAQRVGVVLAGGAGRRLGRTKGDLLLDGEPLAARAASVLWPFCSSVLISVASAADNPAPRHPVVEDEVPGRGPLGGLAAAFRATGAADLLVLACDYPRVDGRILRPLCLDEDDEHDVVLPTDPGGRDHPLVAVWRRRSEPVVREALETGRFAVQGLFPDLRVRRLGPAAFPGLDLGRLLLNLNWPDDLRGLDEVRA